MPEPFLDGDRLRTETFVRHVEIHDTLGSTNDRAAELARRLSQHELPALVVARHQTAGRGRGEHTWWSADGALTFSLLIEPAAVGIGTARWPQLSLVTAVAVCDTIAAGDWGRKTGVPRGGARGTSIRRPPAPSAQPLRIGIKWPNDVLLDGRKLCGILIESPGGAGPAKDRLVIGVGINANNSCRQAPAGAGLDAIALCDVTGQQCDLQALLAGTLNAFATRVVQLSRGNPALLQALRQLDLLTGQNVLVEAGTRRCEGQCAGIGEDGALVVNVAGLVERFHSGSVRLVERSGPNRTL
jgi:BirA family biotin operon repressor/biotin-[acetyl-CoA-carboxylase] ligase